MPRLSRATPKYRHQKPRNVAFVEIDRKRIYLPGTHNSPESRQAYDRLISEWLARGRRLPTFAPDTPDEESAITMAEVMAAYRKFAHSYYVKNGQVTREAVIIDEALRFVRKLYGRTPAVDFGPLKLKAVRQAMIEHGWCRTHINKQIGRVRRMMRWALTEELVPYDGSRRSP